MNYLEKDEGRYHIIVAVLSIISLISIGTVAFEYLEGWSWVTSFYFSVAILMTVGYGDIHPTHESSMLFAAIYILVGVGVTLTAITVIATDRINNTAARLREYADNRKIDKD